MSEDERKWVNDTYGGKTIDEVLEALVQMKKDKDWYYKLYADNLSKVTELENKVATLRKMIAVI